MTISSLTKAKAKLLDDEQLIVFNLVIEKCDFQLIRGTFDCGPLLVQICF